MSAEGSPERSARILDIARVLLALCPEETTHNTQARTPIRGQKSVRSHHSCLWCNARSTPTWRTGPEGHGTLCNRCGIKYARDERRLREKKSVTIMHSSRTTIAALLATRTAETH
jgi:hypothetical protein